MACAPCNARRAAAEAAASVTPRTYRVMGMADDRLIYESHSLSAVETVVDKFAEGTVKVLKPGETA
jgi:hypothetical protein